MSEHVTAWLPLLAASALDPAESARVTAHLEECSACAAEASAWRATTEELRRLPAARPSPALVRRTLEAVETQIGERSERLFNRAALGFLMAFAWTLTVSAWLVFDLVAGGLASWLDRSMGSTAVWYGVYLAAGWATAGAAAVLLGRGAQEEGRMA